MNTLLVITTEIISDSMHSCYSVYFCDEIQNEPIEMPDILQVFYWTSLSTFGVSAALIARISLSFSMTATADQEAGNSP